MYVSVLVLANHMHPAWLHTFVEKAKWTIPKVLSREPRCCGNRSGLIGLVGDKYTY